MLSGSKVEFEGAELSIRDGMERSQSKEHESSGAGARISTVGFLPRANRGRGRKLGIGAGRTTHQQMEVDIHAHNDNDPQVAPSASDSSTKRSQADFKAMLLGGSKN